MANALLTGVDGLKVHQQMLDVVGNNLANLNTPGFKEQRARFSDLVYETLSQATSSTSEKVGGTNPLQVGLGVKLAAIDTNLQQGSLEATNGDFDVAIEGAGYFVVNNGVSDLYTRAGGFSVDENNFLVDPATGFHVQRFGTIGEGTSTTPAFQTPNDTSIKIPFGTGLPGQVTKTVTLQGNLSANAVGPQAQTLTSAQPYRDKSLPGNPPAGLGTLLNNLTINGVPYVAGDQIRITGTRVDGSAVNALMNVDNTTTMGDLVNFINGQYGAASTCTLAPPPATAAPGSLVLTANNTGPNNLSLTIADRTAPPDTGSSSWATTAMQVTTLGKNGDTVTTAIQIYDSQGTPHNLSLTFTKVANDVWNLTGTIPPGDGTVIDGRYYRMLWVNS